MSETGTQLQTIINEQDVAKADVSKLIEAFGAPFTEAGVILGSYQDLVVKDELDLVTMAKAREQRLVLKKARTTVENNRKALKSDIVKQGRAIDAIAKFVKEQIEPAEKHLELQEKYSELKAAERIATVRAERIAKLSQYVEDTSIFNLDEMTDERFEVILVSAKAQKDAEIAIAKQAEADRIAKEKAEAEERVRIAKENEALKAEASKREAEEAKRRATEAKERAKLQAEADAKMKVERDAREKLEAEARARNEADRKAREAKEAEEAQARADEAKAKNAGDAEKLTRFSEAIEIIRREKMPVMTNEANRAVVSSIDSKLASIQDLIKQAVETQ